MLYPSLESLVKNTKSRYHLVNIVAKKARAIEIEAENNQIKLSDKPVRLAILELDRENNK